MRATWVARSRVAQRSEAVEDFAVFHGLASPDRATHGHPYRSLVGQRVLEVGEVFEVDVELEIGVEVEGFAGASGLQT